MNNLWKRPAWLWRQREPVDATDDQPSVRRIASGSLEEMIRRALSWVEADRPMLFIDCGAGELLGWSDIRSLSRSPNFPVEI